MFKVTTETVPVKVKLKDTSIEYTVNDVLNLYFSYLTMSTMELEPDKVNMFERCLTRVYKHSYFF